MNTLSERQRSILQFIVTFVGENEFPPTIREIGEQVGISSTSVVNYNLAKLEELGLITRRKEVSRGLCLNWDRMHEMNLASPASPLPASGAAAAKNAIAVFEACVTFRVPVLGAIAAGQPIQVEAREPETADDWIELPDGLIKARGPLFALRVKGDSMIDASVLNGDLVVLRHQETANDGDMVAAWIEGDEETTLKYLFREGRNVRLQPANPSYQPIIRPANKVRINGKVVYIMRALENSGSIIRELHLPLNGNSDLEPAATGCRFCLGREPVRTHCAPFLRRIHILYGAHPHFTADIKPADRQPLQRPTH